MTEEKKDDPRDTLDKCLFRIMLRREELPRYCAKCCEEKCEGKKLVEGGY
jgi:hypothetical protein